LRELNEELRLWDVLVDPARKIRIGNKLYFGDDDSMVAEVIDNTTSRGRTLRFLYDGPHDEFKKALYALGEAPLPSFIRRPVEEEDAERFQTIFAKNEGAVTAPTAGLHFSRELMKRMEIKGIDFALCDNACPGFGVISAKLMWKILPSIRWILNRCLLMLKLVILSIRQKMRTDVFVR